MLPVLDKNPKVDDRRLFPSLPFLRKRANSKFIWGWFGLISAIYILIVLLAHFTFDTHTCDLGIFDQGVWRYSRFEAPLSSIKGFNLLSDHFTPVLVMVAPFYWLWNDSATLLIVQVLALMSGVFPVWWLSRKFLKSNLAYYPPLFYALFYGVESALNFDFHTESLAAAALIWAIWAFEAGYTFRYLAFWGLVLLCKETFPAYLSFWSLYVLVTQWRDPFKRNLHLCLFVLGFGLFFAEQNLIMPFLGGRPYYYNDYGDLGQSIGEVIINCLKDPGRLVNALFGEQAKQDLLIIFFFSGGGALLVRPALLLLLLPNIIERFLNPSPLRWQVEYQYNVILTPIFAYAVIQALAVFEQNRGRWRKPQLLQKTLWLWLVVVLALNCGWYGSVFKNGFANLYFLFKDTSATREAVAQIPPGASVLASERLVPHLDHREEISQLYAQDNFDPTTDYIIISLQTERNTKRLLSQIRQVNEMRQRTDYRQIYERDRTYVFQRLSPGQFTPVDVCRSPSA